MQTFSTLNVQLEYEQGASGTFSRLLATLWLRRSWHAFWKHNFIDYGNIGVRLLEVAFAVEESNLNTQGGVLNVSYNI